MILWVNYLRPFYAPWALATCCVVAIALVRVYTRRITDLRPAPPVISLVYVVGHIGLAVAFLWSIFGAALWACIPVIGLYAAIQILVPSPAAEFARGPVGSHLAAIEQAKNELRHLPPGPDSLAAVMKRADEIMRSRGWIPKKPE
jgi:hypothetical protein